MADIMGEVWPAAYAGCAPFADFGCVSVRVDAGGIVR